MVAYYFQVTYNELLSDGSVLFSSNKKTAYLTVEQLI